MPLVLELLINVRHVKVASHFKQSQENVSPVKHVHSEDLDPCSETAELFVLSAITSLIWLVSLVDVLSDLLSMQKIELALSRQLILGAIYLTIFKELDAF